MDFVGLWGSVGCEGYVKSYKILLGYDWVISRVKSFLWVMLRVNKDC
jgi:hypothetical protein